MMTRDEYWKIVRYFGIEEEVDPPSEENLANMNKVDMVAYIEDTLIVEAPLIVYQEEKCMRVIYKGEYSNHKYVILNLGQYPAVYIGIGDLNVTSVEDELVKNIEVHYGLDYYGKAYWDNDDKEMYLGYTYDHAGDWLGHYGDEENLEFGNKKWTFEDIQKDIYKTIDQLNSAKKKMERLTDFQFKFLGYECSDYTRTVYYKTSLNSTDDEANVITIDLENRSIRCSSNRNDVVTLSESLMKAVISRLNEERVK